jgi:hypothetical protein
MVSVVPKVREVSRVVRAAAKAKARALPAVFRAALRREVSRAAAHRLVVLRAGRERPPSKIPR